MRKCQMRPVYMEKELRTEAQRGLNRGMGDKCMTM